jgi:hypothetical protein
MENFREMVEAGGLMAFGVNMSDFIGRAASHVDKTLKERSLPSSQSSSQRNSS